MSRTDFHAILVNLFEDKAITYRTLERLEKGENDGKSSSLHQIAAGLGLTMRELMAGTEEETPLIECMRKTQKKGRYVYNPKAFAEILTGSQAKFLASELVLEPGATTSVERDPEGGIEYQKWVYVTMGTVVCVIDKRKITLRKRDAILFYSRLPHSFTNDTSRPAHCIIVQNPKHI